MLDEFSDPDAMLDVDEYDEDIELSQLEELEEKQEAPSPVKKTKEVTCGDIEDEHKDMLKKGVPQDQIFLILARKYGYTPYEIEMIVL